MVTSSYEMKLFLIILMCIQLAQFLCYTILHQYIGSHNYNMLQLSVISSEIYQKRKSIHAMSMMNQHICFFIEFLHLGIIALIRSIGSRYFDIDDLNLFLSTFKTSEFCFLPTMQVFLSTELKKELIYLIFDQ